MRTKIQKKTHYNVNPSIKNSEIAQLYCDATYREHKNINHFRPILNPPYRPYPPPHSPTNEPIGPRQSSRRNPPLLNPNPADSLYRSRLPTAPQPATHRHYPMPPANTSQSVSGKQKVRQRFAFSTLLQRYFNAFEVSK